MRQPLKYIPDLNIHSFCVLPGLIIVRNIGYFSSCRFYKVIKLYLAASSDRWFYHIEVLLLDKHPTEIMDFNSAYFLEVYYTDLQNLVSFKFLETETEMQH